MRPPHDEARPLARDGLNVESSWGPIDNGIVTLAGVRRHGGALSLDWTDAAHWSARPRHCRTCAGWTNLLDDAGLPSHKVCAEAVAR